MSKWLSLAHQIFQSCPATLRHAILLTDGQNGDLGTDWTRRSPSARGCSGVTAGVSAPTGR